MFQISFVCSSRLGHRPRGEMRRTLPTSPSVREGGDKDGLSCSKPQPPQQLLQPSKQPILRTEVSGRALTAMEGLPRAGSAKAQARQWHPLAELQPEGGWPVLQTTFMQSLIIHLLCSSSASNWSEAQEEQMPKLFTPPEGSKKMILLLLWFIVSFFFFFLSC